MIYFSKYFSSFWEISSRNLDEINYLHLRSKQKCTILHNRNICTLHINIFYTIFYTQSNLKNMFRLFLSYTNVCEYASYFTQF